MSVADHRLYMESSRPVDRQRSMGAARPHRGSRNNTSGNAGSRRYKGDGWLTKLLKHNRLRCLADDGMLWLSLFVQQFGREFQRRVADE
ncbi:hypothetical protein QBC45DRAFT_336947 [Copromyces sp. CBS 386.78]|nr:hypothetical protein QBC45DRAFT_336947 [Copromyces sp. CBS 386.78]